MIIYVFNIFVKFSNSSAKLIRKGIHSKWMYDNVSLFELVTLTFRKQGQGAGSVAQLIKVKNKILFRI